MRGRSRTWDYGSISVTTTSTTLADGRARRLYEWRPSSQLRNRLPADFCLAMIYVVDSTSDANKTLFVPPYSALDFFAQASLGGLAILAQREGWSTEKVQHCRALLFIFQLIRHKRQFSSRQIKRQSDLQLKTDRSDRSYGVLPMDLGLDSNGQGKRLSIQDLLREGDNYLRENRSRVRREEACIRAGLHVAAKRNPLELTRSEIEALIRTAFFPGSEADDSVDRRTRARIRDELNVIIADHLDDSSAAFRLFLRDPKADVVHRISKRLRLTRNAVQNVLLGIGWEAFQLIAKCIHAQMRAFAFALPEPLHRDDKKRFEVLYYAPPWLAGFPLIFLKERFGFLGSTVDQILDSPNDDAGHAVLHRMLWFYNQILDARRADDRAHQARREHKRRTGVSATERQFDEANYVPPSHDTEVREIARDILERRTLVDEIFFDGDWDVRISGEIDELRLTFTSEFGRDVEIKLSEEEVKRMRSELS